MSQYLDFTGLQTLWGRIKEYAKITTTSGTTKVVIGANEVTIPDGISPYDSAPEMDGTASAGNSSSFARGNHVHPKDTTKADKATTLAGYGITDAKITNGTITLGGSTITPLTSYTETDPVFAASAAYGISSSDIANWNGKQAAIDDLADIRSGAALGATALQSFTETDPTVPSWAKQSTKPSYTASEVGAVATTAVGAASGVCPLDSGGKVASTYLPGYVDDVVEAYPRSGQTELSQNWLSTTSGGSALTPETGKIYVLLAASTNYAVNSEFRWGGSTYVQLHDGGLTPMTTSEIETATPLT